MKKLFALFILSLSFLGLAGCAPKSGGTEFYSAKRIGTVAYQEERSITISKHEFIYYNVYSDEKGNFILKDETSYIKNNDLQFGLRFHHSDEVVIYDITKDPMTMLEPICTDYENGDYGYQVDRGFMITINPSFSTKINDINIGQIGHWC